MRLSKRHGQSVIEYSLIIIVVAAGIIVMGPYLIRSVNAQLKMWEESVNDSIEENLQEAEASIEDSFPLPAIPPSP